MMWLSSSYNSCLNFFLTERFVFLNGFVLFFLSLVFNIELVIPIWGQMNHHFNFLYIFFFMLIIVLKDKCDFNIHAYWFIFSSRIWKNSKEILFLMPYFSFQFLYEIPNRWRQVLLAKWFCWLCCRVLFLKGKNVVLNAWISSYMYFILMYFDVKVKKIIRKSLLFVRTHTNKK